MNSELGLFFSSGLMELYSTKTVANMQHRATFKVHIFSYLFRTFDSPMDERTRNNLYTLSPRSVTVHCIFSGLFGSAVGKRMGNNLNVCYVLCLYISSDLFGSAVDEKARNNLIYLVACLAY